MESHRDAESAEKKAPKTLLETVIQLALVGFLVVSCAWVVSPFASLLLWGVVLAVILYPLHQVIAGWLGGRQASASVALVLAGLLVIGTPLVMLGSSFAVYLHKGYVAFENDALHIPTPAPAIAEWPLVGERVHAAWNSAASDFPAFIEKNKTPLANMFRKMFGVAANTAVAVLLFLASLILAGVIMTYGRQAAEVGGKIMTRFGGTEDGPMVQALSVATVRSVASGVVGVAFIQALVLGVGFIFAGIPAAGVLAFLVLLVGILQLPAMIISLPAIAMIWLGDDGTTATNIGFTIYLVLGGMLDNVLKPLLLGRGVDAPMPVVLLGALGGMVVAGIIGLFVGAVLLAVGYQVFMAWVNRSQSAAS